jgi:hypothetical protein
LGNETFIDREVTQIEISFLPCSCVAYSLSAIETANKLFCQMDTELLDGVDGISLHFVEDKAVGYANI